MTPTDNSKVPGGYSVGYGKPPIHSRFKKGVSGNPNGRPKGTRNFVTVLLKTLREKVVINENGKRTVITKLEAAVKQLVNKAAAGNLVAVKYLVGITQIAEQTAADEVTHKEVLNELDEKVMRNILIRYERSIRDEGATLNEENTD